MEFQASIALKLWHGFSQVHTENGVEETEQKDFKNE